MAQEFDDTFKELERSVMEDMKKVYSEKAIDHFLKPRNLSELPAPDGFATVTGPCGDTMEIYLRVRDNKIVNASFRTDGCGPSIASGSVITGMASGKTIKEAYKISGNDVLDALGGLPEASKHCAVLAADTLKAAIKDCLAMKREPWKKAYRNG